MLRDNILVTVVTYYLSNGDGPTKFTNLFNYVQANKRPP